MNPRIRSPRTDHDNFFTGHFFEAFLEDCLDGGTIGLHLPAAVVCAFVLEGEFNAGHDYEINFSAIWTAFNAAPLRS